MLWRDWRLEAAATRNRGQARRRKTDVGQLGGAGRRRAGLGQLRRTQRQHLKLLNLCSLLAPARAHLAQSL